MKSAIPHLTATLLTLATMSAPLTAAETTAKPSSDFFAYFGTGRGGLDLWNSLRAASPGEMANEQINLISDFLVRGGSLSTAVKKVFSDASPAELLEQIIEPIQFLAGQQDGGALVRQIRDRLVLHGAASSIPPADAELVFDAL